MHCLECATHDHTETTAVGVCNNCGAAVCAHHAHIVTREVQQQASLAPYGHRQARAVLCSHCAEMKGAGTRPASAAPVVEAPAR